MAESCEMSGGLGIDSIYGDAGADRLYAADGGSDRALDCGSGTPGDVAFTDPFDPPARHCATPRATGRPEAKASARVAGPSLAADPTDTSFSIDGIAGNTAMLHTRYR